jgi:hypothetical protein
MENKDDLVGTLARLPDGQLARIESVEGTSAQVRRVDGDRAGTLAVCDIDKLRPA